MTTAALCAAPTPADPKKDKTAPTTAEKIRHGLDKPVTIDVNQQPLTAVLKEISDATGVPLVVDRFVVNQMGMEPEQIMIQYKGKDVKARTALRAILGQFNLSYGIVGDNVLVTTDEMAMYRQLRQRVNVDYDGTEFAAAIKRLSRETGTNLIIDSRSAKEGKNAVTLQLEDVPLETAVRLMSEMVGLKPVRVGNVMFITSKAAANDLKSDPDLTPPNPMGNPAMLEKLAGIGGLGGVVIGGAPVPPPAMPPMAVPPAPPQKEETPAPPIGESSSSSPLTGRYGKARRFGKTVTKHADLWKKPEKSPCPLRGCRYILSILPSLGRFLFSVSED